MFENAHMPKLYLVPFTAALNFNTFKKISEVL